MNIDFATLKLFNAIEVEDKKPRKISESNLYKMVKNGYIADSCIRLDAETMSEIETVVGIGGNKLNSSFHKSWNKVATASDFQLIAEQILHYITTYGFEALGIYDEKFVYIPAEKLNLPKIYDNTIPLLFIKGLTSEELLSEIVKIGSSGIALSPETLENIMFIVRENEYDYNFITEIKNRELYGLLCDFYDIVPSEPVQYLRYLVTKLTGESLVIKNKYLIEKIKSSAESKTLDKLLLSAPENLASIFYRFKPIFLALKAVSHNKTFFNQLRKQAVFLHEPLGVDYLNNVTASIKNKTFKISEFKKALENYSVWRKIRLAYALKNRLSGMTSIVYKVRNGKGWVTDFENSNLSKNTEKALELTLKSISSDIRDNVEGKVFFIPSNVHYSLPTTEKQFTGNVPANTYVSVPEDLIVGVHWYNGEHNRVDIDLSLIDVNGKFGWDRHYRDSERTVLFSGDVTDAPLPNGATELFYLKKGVVDAKLIMANYFNFDANNPVDCQLVVGKEKPSHMFEGKRNYMIDPNNIVISESVKIDKHQNSIGLIINVDGESRVYFSETSIGSSITSRNDDKAIKTLDFLISTCVNTIELKDVLEMAGAVVTDIVPDEGEYISLSPESLDKTTIIALLTVGQ